MNPPPQLRYIISSLDEDGVFLLKYNRPEVGNAINTSVIKELLQALQWAIADPRVKAIVQTGEGKFFSTGKDLSSPKSHNQGQPESSPRILYEVNKLLINCEKVTIAAVNGPGVGYGASSIGLFDLVYVVPDAYFFTPFIKWGLCAEACSSFTFANAMGRAKASHVIFTGERINAQDLEKAGLVSKVIPRENLLGDVLAIARNIAKLPPLALKANKQLLASPWKEQLQRANELELRHFQDLAKSDDAKRAVEMFAAEQALKKGRNQKL